MGLCQSCEKPNYIRSEQQTKRVLSLRMEVKDPVIQKNVSVSSSSAHLRTSQTHKERRRQYMDYRADLSDDFVTHHLKYELGLARFSTARKIRGRQIAQHIILQPLLGNITGLSDPDISIPSYVQSFVYAWVQHTFLEIWNTIHQQLLTIKIQIQTACRKMAQHFMFQLSQLREFLHSGTANIIFKTHKTTINLGQFTCDIDGGLLHLLKGLKKKCLLNIQNVQLDVPEFPNMPPSGMVTSLQHQVTGVGFTDPHGLNYLTIYQDITALLNNAVQMEADFTSDMKELFGYDAVCGARVPLVIENGQKQFSASAICRLFIKWVQNLLVRSPELQHSRSFLNFVRSKTQILNRFCYTSSKSSHQLVVQCLCELLQATKFSPTDNTRNKEFIYHIYDTLRCKIVKSSPKDISKLYQQLAATKISKSGRKIEIVSVRNRLKVSGDLVVNFRYGGFIIAQARICLQQSQQHNHNYGLAQFITKLESSILGPTLELMMIYEDRRHSLFKFEGEGPVKPRERQIIDNLQASQKICFNGHPMVSMSHNYHSNNQNANPTMCSHCGTNIPNGIRYLCCFRCGWFVCIQCQFQYDQSSHWLSIQNYTHLVNILNQSEFRSFCKKSIAAAVLFWQQGSTPSDLMRHCITLHSLKTRRSSEPILGLANATKSQMKELCKLLNISEYPTLVLFDAQAKPMRKLIGFQWLEVGLLFKAQRQMLNSRSAVIELICAEPGCNGWIKLRSNNQTRQSVCNICLNQNKFEDMPNQYQHFAGFCEKGHYRCIACCYAILPIPSTYRASFGNYLSSSFDPKLGNCPSGHLLSYLTRNPLQQPTYECCVCKNERIFDSQTGVGYCKICESVKCAFCMGYQPQPLNNMKRARQLAVHLVQSTAQTTRHCACRQPFKKTYSARTTTLADYLQQGEQSEQKWTCFICQLYGIYGELHYACFGCPILSTHLNQLRKPGQPQKYHNLEICISCAKKIGITDKQSKRRKKTEKSGLKCPVSTDELIITNQPDEEYCFECHSCKQSYLANTQRYHCPKCKISICRDKRECRRQIWRSQMHPVEHKCHNDHTLKFTFIDDNQLQFCNGCLHMLQEVAYSCKFENYSLCHNCIISTSPIYKGSLLQNLRQPRTLHLLTLDQSQAVSASDYVGRIQETQNEQKQLKGETGQWHLLYD